MGKSARSNKKKQTRTVRRARLESTKWVQEADKKRLEALAQCVEAPAAPVINSLPKKGAAESNDNGSDGGMDTEEDRAPASRGRPGKPKKAVAVPILPVPLPSSAMEAEGGGKKTKGGKKGKVGGAVGVTKPQAKKKVNVLWVSEFHKKHGSKKRRR